MHLPPIFDSSSNFPLIEALAQAMTFQEVLGWIDQHYHYMACAFQNGDIANTATQNQGSAKILYFAHLHQFTQTQTLMLYREHYQHVLATPDLTDHQNIRQFIRAGWAGVHFAGAVLTRR